MNGSSELYTKRGLSKLLTAIALGEGDEKHAAAQRILNFETTTDYPIQLIELVLDPNRLAPMRILACSKLKDYLESHWCSTAEKFLAPEIHEKYKTTIKNLLFIGLNESEQEVRGGVADIIVCIVQWEWPHNWPQFFEMLLDCLRDASESSVLGGLRVLEEFEIKITDAHMQSIGIVILDEMIRIFICENKYSVETRRLACRIFSELVSSTVMYRNPDTIQRYLKVAVLQFTETSIQIWTSLKSDDELKITILKTVAMLMDRLPKYISGFLTTMLPLVWGTLIDCAKDYQANVVDGDDDAAYNSEDLVLAIFEFIGDFMSSMYGYAHDVPSLRLLDYEWFYLQDNYVPPDALYHLIMLMKITDKQITQWNDDVNDFVEKEEMKIHEEDGIRRTAEDLIVKISGCLGRAIGNGMVVVLMKHLSAESMMQVDGAVKAVNNDWKSREALLKAFCLMKETIVWRNSFSLCYDIVPFFKNVLADLNNPASHPLLVGRCLCFAGTYAAEIRPNMAPAFLESTINSLREDKPACEKICAAIAVYLWYYRDDSGKGNDHQEILKSKVPVLFEGLCNLAKSSMSLEVLTLVLKSITSIMPFDKAFTASMKDRIYSLASTMLLEYRKDSIYFYPWLDIFKELTMNPQCIQSLQQRLTPSLLSLMIVRTSENRRDDVTALYIVQVLVQHSPAPLSNLLINTVFPAVCNCILSTKESWSLRHGIEVIHTYLLVSPKQIIDHRSGRGKTGAQFIIQATNHVLNTKCGYFVVSKTCTVLLLLIEKTGCNLGENLDELLEALLSHAQDKNWVDETKRCLLVYAHLIGNRFKTVCTFLFRKAGYPAHKSPLDSIVVEGFCRLYTSFGIEERKIINLAFIKIIEYGVSNLSSRLHKVTFKVDARTSVPLLVAICRLMLHNDKYQEASEK